MCGIVGYVGTDRSAAIDSALASIKHRGPDAQGSFLDQIGDRHIGLGHVRLSILDLSSGADQPFFSLDRQHTLIYNGELYNHDSFRSSLSDLGWRFRTHSDTEVLLACLIQWGVEILPALDGIFAFAWFDRVKQRLVLGRDRLGIKPLYLHRSAGDSNLIFASEIKAIAALTDTPLRPDRSRYAEFLLNGFLYEPASGVVGIEKLLPGAYLELDLQTCRSSVTPYVKPLVPSPSPERGDFGAAIERSTGSQLLADVKVGLSFSGGIDSSVLAMAAPAGLQGLFVSFEPAHRSAPQGDELYSKLVANTLKLTLDEGKILASEISNDEFLAQVTRVARGTEEPISNFTYVASELVADMARQRGYKVLLSGMGADELFAGYPRHRLVRYHKAFRCLAPALRLAKPLLRRVPSLAKKTERLIAFASESNFGLAYSALVGYFDRSEVTRLLGSSLTVNDYEQRIRALLAPVAHLPLLRQAMHLDSVGYLAQNLTVTDKSSMAQGIEVRVPLLSNEMLVTSGQLRDRDLGVQAQGKKPLRDYLLTRLPRELVYRKKTPFNPPLDAHINQLGQARLLEELTSGPIADELDVKEISQHVRKHFSGEVNNTYRLWQLLYFSRWLRSFSTSVTPSRP